MRFPSPRLSRYICCEKKSRGSSASSASAVLSHTSHSETLWLYCDFPAIRRCLVSITETKCIGNPIKLNMVTPTTNRQYCDNAYCLHSSSSFFKSLFFSFLFRYPRLLQITLLFFGSKWPIPGDMLALSGDYAGVLGRLCWLLVAVNLKNRTAISCLDEAMKHFDGILTYDCTFVHLGKEAYSLVERILTTQ